MAPLLMPDASSTPTQETLTTICDLDEVVLTHILARLHNPLPLAVTCKTVLHALNSHPCRQEWFNRWYGVPRTLQQPVALTLLGWKPVRQYSTAQLSKFLVTTVEQNTALRKQYHQQLLKSPELVRRERWLQLLRLFVPWPEHLLLVATAASCHGELLAELLHADCLGDADTSCKSSDSHSGVSSDSSSDSVSADRHLTGMPSQHQQQQQTVKRRPLPACLHLPNQQHEVLQSALLAAAAAGQQRCTSLLLEQVQRLPPSIEVVDLMSGALEAAAAAGEVHTTVAVMVELFRAVDLFIKGVQRPKQPVQRQGERLHQQFLPPDVAGILGPIIVQEKISLTAHYSQCCSSSSSSSSTASLDSAQSSQEAQESAAFLTECTLQSRRADRVLHIVHQGNSYLLIAAARGGSTAVVSMVLQFLPSTRIKQQLPAALAAAGRAGHLDVLLLLLCREEVSSKPLEMAAADAAVRPWPAAALDALLQHIVKHFRLELLVLLHKPLCKALQNSSVAAQQVLAAQQSHLLRHSQQQVQLRAAAEAMFRVLQAEAVIEFPEMLGGLLLVLAKQGECDKVCWVLKAAPTVLVKLGPAAAAAALEGGHTQLAQVILDAGGERPAAFKAAAKRGELVAAVRNRDVATVKALLQECSLPLVWTCEAAAAAATNRHTAAAAGAEAAHVGEGEQAAVWLPGLPNPIRVIIQDICVLNLLNTAAAAGAPESVALLRLLLPALPSTEGLQRSAILAGLMKFCLDLGLVAELEVVLGMCGRLRLAPTEFATCLAGLLQLPDDADYLGQNGDISSGRQETPSTAAPGPIAAAIALHCMQHPVPFNVLTLYFIHPHLQLGVPETYMGVVSRPAFPPLFISCKKGLQLFLLELTKFNQLPPSVKVNDASTYREMVRVILEACDAGLLHAFLTFMDKHGEELLADVAHQLEGLEAAQFGVGLQ